jgi:hypothetical protein
MNSWSDPPSFIGMHWKYLKIKSGVRLQEDVDVWAFESTGAYSVRSCYRALKKEQEMQEALDEGDASSSDEAGWW